MATGRLESSYDDSPLSVLGVQFIRGTSRGVMIIE
eukprot:COSAG02_NODE_67391_length_253_cov_0.662338_1_plen_34_part_01